MYAITTTQGFIIGSRPYGEADKILLIFTRDLGLIQATALGIRLEKSKLRYHAQDLAVGTFSLVHGKEFWRLTSAKADERIDTPAYGSGIEIVARVAVLLKRLLHGEEPHPDLFECVDCFIKYLSDSSRLTDVQISALESLTVLRILRALGYIGKSGELEPLMVSFEIDTVGLDLALAKKTLVNQHINKALKESQL